MRKNELDYITNLPLSVIRMILLELSAEEREVLRALGYLTDADTEWVDDARPSGRSNGSP